MIAFEMLRSTLDGISNEMRETGVSVVGSSKKSS
jgi:hypothetical protein